MSRRPAAFTQADIARTIRAAMQAGAAEVEVFARDGAKIIVRISPSTAPESPVEQKPEVVL